jgi:hypothetical protein
MFNEIVNLLTPDMGDFNGRRALIESALWGCPVLQQIDWTGAANVFTVNLVRTLLDYGECTPGKPAIVSVLEAARDRKGTNKHGAYNDLIARILNMRQNPPQGGITMTTPEITGFVFLLEIARWAKDELSQRWNYRRQQQNQVDELATQSAESPVAHQIWNEMKQARSEAELQRIFKLIDDQRTLILQYEQSKTNARKQALVDGNEMLLGNRLQHFDEQIGAVKAELKKHTGKLGIEIVE